MGCGPAASWSSVLPCYAFTRSPIYPLVHPLSIQQLLGPGRTTVGEMSVCPLAPRTLPSSEDAGGTAYLSPEVLGDLRYGPGSVCDTRFRKITPLWGSVFSSGRWEDWTFPSPQTIVFLTIAANFIRPSILRRGVALKQGNYPPQLGLPKGHQNPSRFQGTPS